MDLQHAGAAFDDRSLPRENASVELDAAVVVVDGINAGSLGVNPQQAGLGIDAEFVSSQRRPGVAVPSLPPREIRMHATSVPSHLAVAMRISEGAKFPTIGQKMALRTICKRSGMCPRGLSS
jgi:hypothetical protein